MRVRLVTRRPISMVMAAFAVALFAGCSSDRSDEAAPLPASAAGTHTYVGRAAGSEALIGVVVDGKRFLAYVCDGIPGEPVGSTPTAQTWFNGESNGGSVDASQPGGRLQLQLTDSSMSGRVTLADGRVLPVTGKTTTGAAGLYRAETAGPGGPAVAGWILAADGTQRGGVGGSLTSGTTVLDTTQLTLRFQSLATARISRVGITPIPIP